MKIEIMAFKAANNMIDAYINQFKDGLITPSEFADRVSIVAYRYEILHLKELLREHNSTK